VIYKYLLVGNGQIAEDYANRSKTFKHRQNKKLFPLRYLRLQVKNL